MQTRRNGILLTLFCLSFIALPALPKVAIATEPKADHVTAIQGEALQSVHNKIVRRHAGVKHLPLTQFAKLHSAQPNGLLVLDVRQPKEHAVSHIKGAIRVPPGLSPEDFMTRFGDKLQGRNVVLYCSVGERSSQMAKAIDEMARKSGASGVYNLVGGIFNWHNQRRPLINAEGRTDYVHPFNWWWSRLVERRKLASYEPRPSKTD